MEAYTIVRLVHILAAIIWFGGALFQVTIIGPTLRQAGPLAGGFMSTLARRGGIGRYFAIAGGITILSGGYLYGKLVSAPSAPGAFSMDGGMFWLTLGAILAVLGYLHGLTAIMPIERKWIQFSNSIKGPPTAEQAAQLQAYGMKLGKNGVISAAIIGAALLCMLLSRVLV